MCSSTCCPTSTLPAAAQVTVVMHVGLQRSALSHAPLFSGCSCFMIAACCFTLACCCTCRCSPQQLNSVILQPAPLAPVQQDAEGRLLPITPAAGIGRERWQLMAKASGWSQGVLLLWRCSAPAHMPWLELSSSSQQLQRELLLCNVAGHAADSSASRGRAEPGTNEHIWRRITRAITTTTIPC